jgi:hypothetical protein
MRGVLFQLQHRQLISNAPPSMTQILPLWSPVKGAQIRVKADIKLVTTLTDANLLLLRLLTMK